MASVVITLEHQEIMQLEAILMDRDPEAAFNFIKEVLMPKVRAKGASRLDPSKGTGIRL